MSRFPDMYTGGVAVTPDDTAVIAPSRAIMVGGDGEVAVKFADNGIPVILNLLAGTIYTISVVQVLAANTTATDIVALY